VEEKGSLFDADVEHYDGPALETESTFHFLNRADGPLWQRTREVCEEWYAGYPDSDGDLRARFRSDAISQHFAAWWELYIFMAFRRLGYDVEVHPAVPGTEKRPDFRVSRGMAGMFVECAAMAGDDVVENPAGQAWIIQCINNARNPDFMVQVEITGVGTDHPTVDEIVRPIEDWLAALDYDVLSELFDTSMDAAEEIFEFRDWEVRIVALPVNEESRGRDRRMVGVNFTGVRELNEEGKIRTVLRKKGSRYGTLDEPLIVALLSLSSFTNEREMTNAVFGSVGVTYEHDLESAHVVRQQDGYWRPPPSKRGSRIAGVLFGESKLKPWWVADQLPELWLNPWAPTPVAAALPFTTHTADDNGNLTSTAAGTTLRQLFDLPTD
jgi:hypothetical protein